MKTGENDHLMKKLISLTFMIMGKKRGFSTNGEFFNGSNFF